MKGSDFMSENDRSLISGNEALQRALAKYDEKNQTTTNNRDNSNNSDDEMLKLIKEISKKVNFLYVLAIISLVLSIISGIILPFMR